MTQATQAEQPKPPVARGEPEPKNEGIEDAPRNTLDEAVSKKRYRTYTFTVPKKSRLSPHDPAKITLRELDPDLMTQARKLSAAGGTSTSDEAVKLSLWMIDGRPVDHTIDEATYYWGRFSAKVRHHCNVGWGAIHATEPEEDEAFLSSMVAE